MTLFSLKALIQAGFLMSGQAVFIFCSAIGSMILARGLGPSDFGAVLTIVSVVSVINSLFSSRFADTIIKFYTEFHLAGDHQRLCALNKTCYLTEGSMRLLAFIATYLSADLLSDFFLDSNKAAALLRSYSLILLLAAFTETSLGVLQIKGKFSLISKLQSLQGLSFLISLATLIKIESSPRVALLCYLISIGLNAVLTNIAALRALRRELGADWYRVPALKLKGTGGRFSSFVFHRNLASTISLITKASDPLWLAFFRSTQEVALYKVASSLQQLAIMPSSMMASVLFPHVTSAVTRKDKKSLRALIFTGTSISFVCLIIVALVVYVFGEWMTRQLFGQSFVPGLKAFWPLLLGSGIASAFFWLNQLLLALGMPGTLTGISSLNAVLKVAFSLLFIPTHGFVGAAWILAALYILGTLIMLFYARRAYKTHFAVSSP